MRTPCLLLLVMTLLSCSRPQEPLRVGLLEWPPYEIARLAVALDHMNADRIQIVDFQVPAEARRAYAAGSIDIIALTVDYALALAVRDPDHRVFLVIDESFGGDAAISRLPLTDLSAIAGKRVGFESSELGSHMLRRMLNTAGLTETDIKPVSLDMPAQLDAWEAGAVDILITYEPIRTQLLARGGHQVFSSRDIPGEIVDVFIARQSQIEARRADYLQFAESWFHALAFFEDNPEEAARRLAPRLDMSTQQFLQALEGVHLMTLRDNHAMLGPGPGRDAFLNGIRSIARSVQDRAGAPPPADLQPFFTTTVLPGLPQE